MEIGLRTKPQGSPVPVKKFRNVLRNWAYVVVVDEFRTSKKCSHCESEEFDNEPHEVMKMKRIEAGDLVPTIDSHEFVRCSNNACTKIWQRDIHSATGINHLKIFTNWINNMDRPRYLQRSPINT